jgi:hypothetical protein
VWQGEGFQALASRHDKIAYRYARQLSAEHHYPTAENLNFPKRSALAEWQLSDR